ncbi:hypothetical protein M0R45_004539 [Rubus argutus]|uniref:Uncharacterized protein n=1 Tax=Rubus argutus TaxID=59490 RepID=A0AAW1YK58_RUBAR
MHLPSSAKQCPMRHKSHHNFKRKAFDDDNALKKAVAHQPFSVTIEAGGMALQLYDSMLETEWKGFPFGTKATAAGGVTTLVDMSLNNFPSIVSRETLELKLKAVESRIYIDVGFWGGLVPENAFNKSALEDLLQADVLGLKVITGYLLAASLVGLGV